VASHSDKCLMKIENNTLKFFAFDILMPDESCSRFGIFHDLAALFGLEYNAEAVKLLRKTLRASDKDPKRKARIDWEADRVSITTAQAGVILVVAETINELSAPEFRQPFDEAASSQLLDLLTSWERPRPKKWKVGDVFCIPLRDGSFAYGQVLAQDYRTPTCSLFELRTEQMQRDWQVVPKSRIITILHLGPELLDKGIWVVLGNQPVSADPDSGPGGRQGQIGCRSFGANKLVQLAEAYHGLIPWNSFYKQDYLDELLMEPHSW